MRTTAVLIAGALALALAVPAGAQSVSELDRRLSNLERRLGSDALLEMVNELSAMREDVNALRGRLDEIERKVSRVEDRQRQMYADLDERLRAQEERAEAPRLGDAGERATDGGDIGVELMPEEPERSAAELLEEAREGEEAIAAAERTDEAVADTADEAALREAYQAAFNTLRDGRYDDAAAQFRDYLERYPNSDLADNARYWLGEAYYVVRDFEPAMAHFERVIEDYPDSAKHPDALLKIGFIQYERGRRDASRQTLRELMERFPDSAAANLARQRLDRMGG